MGDIKIGVTRETGKTVRLKADGTLTIDQALSDVLRAPDDRELSAIIRDAIDALDGYEDRMARAWAKRQMQSLPKTQFSGFHRDQALKEIRAAKSFLLNVGDSLKYTDEALAKGFEERLNQRIWADAKQAYRHRNPQGLLWDQLTDEERQKWFDYADESVPPTWENATPQTREHYRELLKREHTRPEDAYNRDRARKIRRRASFKIDFAGYPYRVHPDPTARMAEVATMAQTRGYILGDTGRTELEIAVWDEHYRRALHAYTKPFEPYYEETL